MKKILGLFCVLLIISSFGFGQAGATGKITGEVTDPEGSPLPGVKVTLTGERIGKMTTISSENGNFRFLRLPVGQNYEVRLELPGFQTVIRGGLDIWISSTSQLTIVMAQAAVEEEITVIAASPMVDTKSATVAVNISAEKIALYPSSRNTWTLLNLAPGILVDREDVGGNESGQQSAYLGHGVPDSDSSWRVDGANITDLSAIGAAPAYLNVNAYEEFQISYGANDITAQTGGVQINFVSKRAGNTFSGNFHMYVEDEKWELENIGKHPEAEEAGMITPGIFRFYMYGADFGGPIIKDHLFFYGSWAIQDIHSRTVVGSEDTTWLVSGYGKVNWQYGNNQGDVFYAYDDKKKWGRTMLGAANQGPNTLWDQITPGYLYRFADQHTFGDLLVSFKTIYTDGGFQLDPRGNEVIGDIAVGEDWWVYFEPSYYYDGSVCHYETNRDQINIALDVDYFAEGLLGGDHEIKFGVDYIKADTTSVTYYPQNRMLWRNTDLDDPFNVIEFYTNSLFDVTFNRYSIYFSDTATFGKLTVMAGLRYDQEQGSFNEATGPGAMFEGAPIAPNYLGELSSPAQDIENKWKTLSPRLSFAYDITGDGKNVLKLALARYGSQRGNSFAFHTWIVGKRRISYEWYDDGDGIPESGEFDPTVAPQDAYDYTGFDRTDPYRSDPYNKFASDHNSPLVDELTLSYEREITSDLAASVSLFYKKRTRNEIERGIMADGSIETAANWHLVGNDPNLGQPYYERDETPVAWLMTNTEKSYYQYMAVSFVLKKRFSHKWMVDASVTISDWKQHWDKSEYNFYGGILEYNENQGGFDLTNYDYFNDAVYAPETGGSGKSDIYINSRWMVKIAGLYQLPLEINLSIVFNAREGYVVPYYSDFSRESGLGTTNMYEGGKKLGDDRLKAFWILNFGLEKAFTISERTKVSLHVDAYNFTNNAHILKRNRVLGAGKDDIQDFLTAAVFQFGIRFQF